jgi:uncharacterized protein (TIGR03437 family)
VGTRPAFTAESIAHGASAQAGAVSPGLVVVMYGTGLGPAQLAGLELNADRSAVTRTLAGTRVLFDGVEAPMIYTSAGQLSCIVPYAVEGKSDTGVVVEYNGNASAGIRVPVAPARPGIFSVNLSGTGPGAILNQDDTPNALAPAARGSIIQIFSTGEGLLSPRPADGALAVPPLARPVLPVRVFIGGREAELIYAGAAPSLVSGVLQVNARVPVETAPGEAEVRLEVGGRLSRAGVTVAVRE